MNVKSLAARVDKIPEPDLSRLRVQELYDKLKVLPYEQREILRQQLREAQAKARELQEAASVLAGRNTEPPTPDIMPGASDDDWKERAVKTKESDASFDF